jgi:hypothetical protein
MPGVKTEMDRDYDPWTERDQDMADLRAEDAADRAFRKRYCAVCRTHGGHVAGCPETPDLPEEDDVSNGEEIDDEKPADPA